MASLKNALLKNPYGVVGSLRALCNQRFFSGSSQDMSKPATAPLFPTSLQATALLNLLQARLFSNKKERPKVISQSTLFLQDGVDIQELPILIRRATMDSFPFTKHSYAGQNIRGESELEISFRQALQNCSTVSEVFKLLEVPSDQVRGYSAAFALQRLHVLKHLNNDWNQIHSFIRTAVMRELYDTVEADIPQLSNQMLISLVECYIAAKGFSPTCMDCVNAEIQCRLAESTFSVEEILTLANILKSVKHKSSSPENMPKSSTMTIVSEAKSRFLSSTYEEKGARAQYFDKFCANAQETKEITSSKCSSLLGDVWIHVATRYDEMSEETLPLIMNSLTSDRRYMVNLLVKPLRRHWHALTAEGVIQCLDSLVRLNVYNPGIMSSLGRWAHVNVHLVTPQLLLVFLHAFARFNFRDQNLIRVMERCLSKNTQVETDILGLCVEYCRCFSWVSPIVMDAAAQHFAQHGKTYESLQIYALLRAFGHLHYLPAQPSDFLKTVESVLMNKFYEIDTVQLLEILGSLTFVGIRPHNLVDQLTSDRFYCQVGDLMGKNKRLALMWLKVIRRDLFICLRPDAIEVIRGQPWENRWSILCYTDYPKNAVRKLKTALDHILGETYHHSLPHYGCCAFYLDKDGLPLTIVNRVPRGEVHKRFAILLRSADHFSVNTNQLLGSQVQRTEHLERLGFDIIEIRTGQFLYTGNPLHLKEVLSEYVNFWLMEGAPREEELTQVLAKTLEEMEEESAMDSDVEESSSDVFSSFEALKHTTDEVNRDSKGFLKLPPHIGSDDDD